jgi:hypothetical protein
MRKEQTNNANDNSVKAQLHVENPNPGSFTLEHFFKVHTSEA